MDKPTKPTDLVPRSFGGVKNNFSASLQSRGYEDGVPAIYGGDNLNYQLDATGKELDYCEKICDYINAIPINKTPIVDANNKLVYTQYDIRVYSANETYYIGDYVTGVVNGVKHIYQSLKNDNIGQSLSNETYWKKVDIISDIKTIGRNIGEIIPSTIPLTDAGLHLLDGALIQGSGIYSAFVTYIAGLVSTYPDLFVTEADWQTAITTYGVCGKFVYDSVNNTVRLPKITGIVEGTTDLTALGDLVEAGLPNITGTFPSELGGSYSRTTGAFYYTGNTMAGGQGEGTDHQTGFDASRSSSIYGNSSTVQPQTIKVLYYIVIANSTKTEIEVDIDQIATDLNSKVDKSDLQEVQCVVETYSNDESWYRIWSDGWCEQGGTTPLLTANPHTVTLLKNYSSIGYSVQCTTNGMSVRGYTCCINRLGGSSFEIYTGTPTNQGVGIGASCYVHWVTKGYIEV